jgi:chitin synthase
LDYLIPNIPLPKQVAQIVGPGSAFIGRDATYWLSSTEDRLKIGKCMTELLKVGVLDTRSAGCIISDIVLWVSLTVILGVVLIRFFLALVFNWFISWRLGSIREETDEEIRLRQENVLQWEMNNVEQMHYPKTHSIASMAEINNGPNRLHAGVQSPNMDTPKSKKSFFPSTSRFTYSTSSVPAIHSKLANISATSLEQQEKSNNSTASSSVPRTLGSLQFQNSLDTIEQSNQQQYNFNFDLIHTFMVVTCYSEGEDGLRTTLDSLANSEYPATHKMLLVICDGLITGSGNGMSTPDVVLSMMKDDITPRSQVQPASYVAIADGMKRHNMAKVYAGYYKYNEDPEKTGEIRPKEEQQRVPMIAIVKCGSEAEANDKKPGNRGKRDSQVILMNTMQRVYYGERMCELEYRFCKSIFKFTGNNPYRFYLFIMVGEKKNAQSVYS